VRQSFALLCASLLPIRITKTWAVGDKGAERKQFPSGNPAFRPSPDAKKSGVVDATLIERPPLRDASNYPHSYCDFAGIWLFWLP
jgi:hypothetical protein